MPNRNIVAIRGDYRIAVFYANFVREFTPFFNLLQDLTLAVLG